MIARIFCALLAVGCLLAIYALGSGLWEAFQTGIIRPRGVVISRIDDSLMYWFYIGFYAFGILFMSALSVILAALIILNPFRS
jgi:hypothetical protein